MFKGLECVYAVSWGHSPPLRNATHFSTRSGSYQPLLCIKNDLKTLAYSQQGFCENNRTLGQNCFGWKHKASVEDVTVTIALCERENGLNIKIKALFLAFV